jgi:hypothetical protein
MPCACCMQVETGMITEGAMLKPDDHPHDSDRRHFNVFYVTLSRDTFARVRHAADKKHVSVSEHIEALLEFDLACEAMADLRQREVTTELERVLARLIRKCGQ